MRDASVPDAAHFAKLHFGWLVLLRWPFMSEVHRVGILRLLHHLFILPALFCQRFHPLVVLLLQTVSRAFRNFPRCLRDKFPGAGRRGIQRGRLLSPGKILFFLLFLPELSMGFRSEEAQEKDKCDA